MALTAFKSLNALNPPCLNDILSQKCVPCRMRDSSMIEQPKRRTTTFGLRSFSYVGAKMWNELPTYLKETTDLNDFKSLLDTWNGPDLIDTTFSYLWYTVFMSTNLYSLYIVLYRVTHLNLNLYSSITFYFINVHMYVFVYVYMCVHIYTYTNICMNCAPLPGEVVFLSLGTDIRLPLSRVYSIVSCHVIYFFHCTYYAPLVVY